MAIPQSFIQELLSRADIVDIVGRYVTLKKAGVNFKGLCPFHGEKTPSFTVNAVRQTYHCFGCGAHGDALRFLMEHNGLNFVEAIKDLAQQLGLKVPEENISPREKALTQERKQKQTQLTDLLEQAGKHWSKVLAKESRAQNYLHKRGLSQEVINRFSLGYAPLSWDDLRNVFTSYDDPMLVECGLVIAHEEMVDGIEQITKRYDRFRDRVMFPIRNVKGDVIGFGGRILDQGEPKYLNSPETPVFHKGQELYGLFEARSDIRKAGHVLVTEGYMDVVALAQHGVPQAVATLGTACTPEHVQTLFKVSENIVFSFDGDAAGRKAARRALEASLPHVRDTRSVKFLFLPQEHDPDSYIREHGHDTFMRSVAQATPLSQFLLTAVCEGCDMATAEGRARMLSQAYPLWTQIPAHEALGIQLLGEIAQQAQMTVENLQRLWAQQAQRNERFTQVKTAEEPPLYEDAPFPKAAQSTWSEGDSFDKKPRFPYKNKGGNKRNRVSIPAQAPLTPIEQCVRMLLIHSEWWEHLPATDQELLCAQAGWQGEFFKWLERIVVDRGAQSWAVLSEAARGQSWYELMQILMSGAVADLDVQQQELFSRLSIIRTARQREENERILQRFKVR